MKNKFLIFIIAISLILIPVAFAEISWSNEINTRFRTTVGFEYSMCLKDDSSAQWKIILSNGNVNIIDAINKCYNASGVDSSGNPLTDCCPSSGQTTCGDDEKCTEGYQYCSELPISQCGDSEYEALSTKDIEATDYGEGFCSDELSSKIGDCDMVKACGCHINTNESGDEVCIPGVNYQIVQRIGGSEIYEYDETPSADNPNPDLTDFYDQKCHTTSSEVPGNCLLTSVHTIDNCNVTGQKTVEWTQKWVGGGDGSKCKTTGSQTYPCSGALLSFFNIVSLVLAIIILVIFYLIVNRKKKKYSKNTINQKKKNLRK